MLPRAPGQAPIRTCAPVTLVQQSNLSTIANAVPGCLRVFRPSCGPMLAVLLALLFLFAPSALAGPHDGGTLILHADPGVQYSAGEAYCAVELTACSLAVVEVPADPNTTTVFHVLAAFPEAAQVDLRGVTFGITYDAERLALVAHGSCADFVLPTSDWPASGGGVGMTWDEAQTDRLVDLYWFAGYAYSSSEPSLFELTPHPVQGGAFADGSMPAVVDTIAAYGALGFGMPGLLACPEVEDDGGGEEDGQNDYGFPISVVVTPDNSMEYISGDTRVHWSAGDTVTFDYINGALCVDGLPHFPHPKVMRDEALLEERCGSIPYVLKVFDAFQEYPWNHAVSLWNEFRLNTTYAAAKAYAETRNPEEARSILLGSGLFAWVEITHELGHLALKFEDIGLGGNQYLSLNDTVLELTPPPSLSPDRAQKMARRLISLITDPTLSHEVILQEGNEQVSGRRR